jgi:hypothetical protein
MASARKGPPRKTHEQVIGTVSGYVWHQNRGEPACVSCAHAANAWKREHRLRGKCASGLGWPLTLRRGKQRR